MKMHEATLFNA